MPAAFLFAILVGLRLRYAWVHQDVLCLLLAVQAGMAAVLLVLRRKESASAPLIQRLIAWSLAALPLAFVTKGGEDLWISQGISILGLLLCLWALGTLGTSFGIAPADRGLVVKGPYRLVRHPMYLGELVSYLPIVWRAPTLWNLIIFICLLFGFLLRIIWEEKAIQDYVSYAGQTRWRLLWGVW